MPEGKIDLLAIDRGTVMAPAGCGKTHLIGEALARHTGKPILVLTHTNAGVAALRGRLDRASVPSAAYRLSTIDGWAMKLIATFPSRSGHDPSLLNLSNPKSDYPTIRIAAEGLLKAGHVSDILTASYARLIVDEYQDCTLRQHLLIAYASRALRTCALGDPMQAIFGFDGDALPKWGEVCSEFPVAGELTTPWRWINVGAEALGSWLLDVRGKLVRGQPIDLRTAPSSVTWIELDGTEDHQRRLRAAGVRPRSSNGCVLVIAESTKPASQHKFASQIPGAVVVEAVDLKDLVSFATNLDLSSSGALEQVAMFAQSVMTNVGAADLLRRVRSLTQGKARNPPTDVETAALSFVRAPSYRGAADVLIEISKEAAVRRYRPALLRGCVKALQMSDGADGTMFRDAAIRMREEHRLIGRPLPKRAVGSTLLLKGLEAEVAVILDADALNARNLYVAMTRGSMAVTVCSRSPVLKATP